jgi:glyoxylase-like metal-dependent hydrolase (beta-lactamase superfamily II)
LTASAVAALGACEQQRQDVTVAPETDGYFETVDTVAEGVWVIRQNRAFHLQPVGNVTVVEQADGLVLIDGGGSPGSGARIADLVADLSPKPVLALVVTHWHGDHTLGISAIRARRPSLRVISTARTRESLAGAPMGRYAKDAADSAATAAFQASLDPVEEFMAAQVADTTQPAVVREGFVETLRELVLYRRDVEGLHVVVPTETFETELVLDDPERPIELTWMGRANTDGDAVAWLPRQRIVVTGDLVVWPIPFGFGSYPADWVETLRRVRALGFDVLVPGHGAPQHDAGYVDQLLDLITDMRDQVARMPPDIDLEAARSALDVSAHRRRFADDDAWLGLWFDQYWVYPFAESLWKEARGVPIEQGTG